MLLFGFILLALEEDLDSLKVERNIFIRLRLFYFKVRGYEMYSGY